MKVWLRRAVALLVLIVGIIVAFAAGAVASYYVSAWTASIPLIALTGLAVLAVLSWTTAWLGARLWGLPRRRRFAGRFSAVLAAMSAIALYLAILRPSSVPHVAPIARAGTRYWDLSTGSHIAYSEYDPPAGIKRRPEPILFLHGGPGVCASDFDHAFYKQFAGDGFPVYVFDQAGNCLSSPLPHVREYTLARAVADVEAVRRQIGAGKVILIAHSWGATLAANYMARYPGHVTKVVFHSPGAIWNMGAVDFDYAATDLGPPVSPPLRFYAAALLFQMNPDAAEALLPPREAGDALRVIVDPGQAVCKGQHDRLPHIPVPGGLNPYPMFAAYKEIRGRTGDPHSVLHRDSTPAIVAYAECDFLQWSNIRDYQRTFPNLKTYYLPRAGHYIFLSQPDSLASVIRAFLLGEPGPIAPYQSDADPRPHPEPSVR